MRLLTFDGRGELSATRDLTESDIPPYTILSHTWGADEDEVSFRDLQSGQLKAKSGHQKMKFCASQTQKDGLRHFWLDTCCIDKSNHVELSEAITSMYRWYQRARICYVYLADVASSQSDLKGTTGDHVNCRSWESSFRKSRWFTRGWTLQELLAPKEVIFFSKNGENLGTKSTLEDLISEITSIPVAALRGRPLSQYSVAERLRWTKGRDTKKKEDQAYCLLGIFNVFMPLNYGEGDHAFIRLTRKIHKAPKVSFSLKTAVGATFDSYNQAHQGCHPATRLDLLQSVRDWSHEVRGKRIFWLNGMAGTGKSTIAWTVARWLADLGASDTVALGASFFFKRGESDRASAALLFPTIANQLAASIANFDVFLAEAINADPQICSKSLGQQFQTLILEPMRHLKYDGFPVNYIVIVDALDECENETDILTVLQLWSSLPATKTVNFRLFLTSRPELVIRLGFNKMSADLHHDLMLQEVSERLIKHDIHAFLSDTLSNVREEHNLEIVDDPLAGDWPGSEALQKLTDIASPLFIIAATFCRVIGNAEHPQHGLETVLHSQNASHLSETGQVYMLVLEAMIRSLKNAQDLQRVYHEFRVIVGAIVVLAQPLSRAALAALLGITSSNIQIRLRPLHAVLTAPLNSNALIRPLHASFGEYLTSQEIRQTPYWIDAAKTHSSLWRRCLQVLSSPGRLRENICQLDRPARPRSDISRAQIKECLPLEVRYACRYWVYHLRSSTDRIHDGNDVHLFLHNSFIHWLEALSFMDQLADAIEFVTILQSALGEHESSDVSVFLEDARRFILAFRHIGEQAPLQLYVCAAAFTPQGSFFRQPRYQSCIWLQQCPVTPMSWNLEQQKLEGNLWAVKAVAFSPDGSLLASGGDDLLLWDAKTGERLQKLSDRDRWRFDAVVFSPDGSHLTSKERDGTIRLWEVKTGRLIQRFRHKHSRMVFSLDGSLLASQYLLDSIKVCEVKVCEVWKLGEGRKWRMLRDFNDLSSLYLAAFSSDNSLLAWSTAEGALELRHVDTGQAVRRITRDREWIKLLSFLHNDSLLAFARPGEEVSSWGDMEGQETHDLQVIPPVGPDVAVSPDGSLFALTQSKNVGLWNVETGHKEQELQGHLSQINAVAFSPDGSLLASAGGDHTIRLWEVKIGHKICENAGHVSMVKRLAFSSDMDLLASSDNRSVAVWRVNTGERMWYESTDEDLKRMLSRTRDRYGHDQVKKRLAFSTDASLLMVESEGEQALWRARTGERLDTSEVAKAITTHEFSQGDDEDHTVRRDQVRDFDEEGPVEDRRGLEVIGEWIWCDGTELIWLPQKYRRGIWQVSGNTLTIGGWDGQVSIFKIDYKTVRE